VKYTDKSGCCSFSSDYNPLAQYQVRTLKDGYLGYFDKSHSELNRAFAFINEKTGNDIFLYLTSDSMNHNNYWESVTTRYEIDTLISLLKSNKYPLRSEFPKLLWGDIPALLAIGNNRTSINKYPISALSSSYNKDCYLGIIALWFIESIRISELKNSLAPVDKFPSLTPSLRYSDTNNLESASNIELMEKGYQSYVTWWNEVKEMDKQQASKINPLKKSALKWR
jgi:hypothetical protein